LKQISLTFRTCRPVLSVQKRDGILYYSHPVRSKHAWVSQNNVHLLLFISSPTYMKRGSKSGRLQNRSKMNCRLRESKSHIWPFCLENRGNGFKPRKIFRHSDERAGPPRRNTAHGTLNLNKRELFGKMNMEKWKYNELVKSGNPFCRCYSNTMLLCKYS